uniref:DUF305 domain-containing protein n=1 Tax=Gongylonema pulchrum TaxID=637853 RepID=A0A183E7K1_9BILA
LISDQQRSALELSWTQTPDSINAGVMPAPTQQIVGQLRQAGNDGENGNGRLGTPTDLMTPEQRAQYNRLVIEIAATKTEIASIRERIGANCDAVNSSRVSLI